MIGPNPYAQPPRARNRNGVLWCWRPWRRPPAETKHFGWAMEIDVPLPDGPDRYETLMRKIAFIPLVRELPGPVLVRLGADTVIVGGCTKTNHKNQPSELESELRKKYETC